MKGSKVATSGDNNLTATATQTATVSHEAEVMPSAISQEAAVVSNEKCGAKRKESGSASPLSANETHHPAKRRAAGLQELQGETSVNSGDDSHDHHNDGGTESDNTDYGDDNDDNGDEDDEDDEDDNDDDDDEENDQEDDEYRIREKAHSEEGEVSQNEHDGDNDAKPPLPPGPPPGQPAADEDDGWQAIWDEQHLAYYFYNTRTGESTWTNPRVPEASSVSLPAPGVEGPYAPGTVPVGYVGPEGSTGEEDQGPTFYQLAHGITDPNSVTAEDIANSYGQTGRFNRFTGKWQSGDLGPEKHNDENKSKRQMEFYFDVDAAANSHDGRSLKAERQMKKLSKKELKMFREKRKEKKEQKRRAWLKD